MFTLISIIFIIVAVLIVALIVVRKFPVLAVLDVNNIPGEKEAKFKHKIIKTRVDRDLAHVSGFFARIYLFFHKRWSAFLQTQGLNLEKIKTNYIANLKLPWSEKQKRIHGLSLAAQESLKKEDLLVAEKRLVEIISLDKKNLQAFFDLADLYAKQKKYLEARETYQYALKLSKQNNQSALSGEIKIQEIYFSLAVMEKEAENLTVALDDIREALELEPNSPRYLDLILDLSIMMKEKDLAQEYWNKLTVVNPENKKLSDWQEDIKGLGDIKDSE